ncbi:MAG: hypothetical protein ACE5GA_10630 [Candidatus Zixiibacteriota bacterium]
MSGPRSEQMTRAIRQRRLLFLGLTLAAAGALLLPFRPEVEITRGARTTFDFIEALNSGSTVMISFDHEASSFPEMKPLADALISHLFSRDINVIGLSLFTEGTGLGATLLDRLARKHNRDYGTDYVFLGFKPPPVATILGMGESISKIYPRDYYDTPVADLPLMDSVGNYDDLAVVFTIADGSTPQHWAEYGAARYDVKIITASAAVMVTQFDPYVRAGQIQAILGGLRGAAEYERLLGQVGGGSRGMLAQTSAHLFLALVIIAGNIVFWRSRRWRG